MEDATLTDEARPLQALLRLQDEDLHIDQLRYRRAHLDERAQHERVLTELRTLGEAIARDEAEREREQARVAEFEREIATARARAGTIEARARSSAAGSFRDQEAMATELASLAQRARALEDLELEVLEVLEPIEATLESQYEARAGLEDAATEAASALAAATAAVDAAIAEAEPRRVTLADAVPAELAAEYERLRAHLDGVGAARLEHGACSGCHLTISATDRDRMRHAPPGALFHCEQCGRILVEE